MKPYLFSSVIILGSLCMASCSKQELNDIDFDAEPSAIEVKAGDSITFTFKGNAQNITFFSGEAGARYEYHQRDSGGTPRLQFTSFVTGGTGNNLSVLISSNLAFPADTTAIRNASWTDITSRATISTGVDNTASGIIDLSDIAARSPSVNLAFRYSDVRRSPAQAIVFVRSFLVDKLFQDGSTSALADLITAGWGAVNVYNTTAVWSVNTTRLYLTGGNASSADNEDWLITKTLDLRSAVPDKGVVLKDITTYNNKYIYSYANPGTYKASFVASNRYLDKTSERVKEITITVKP